MNTNEKELNSKIAKWLELISKTEIDTGFVWYTDKENNIVSEKPLDFLHDRNQQWWVIEELIKRGYVIHLYFSDKHERVHIWNHNLKYDEIWERNENVDGTAFISAIEQLIDKENEHTKNNH